MSLDSGRAAEGSEVTGEKRSSGGGAGVSGGGESVSTGDKTEAILSCCFLRGWMALTDEDRSLGLSRSRDFLGASFFMSPISPLSSDFETFTGDVTGSVLTLSGTKLVPGSQKHAEEDYLLGPRGGRVLATVTEAVSLVVERFVPLAAARS